MKSRYLKVGICVVIFFSLIGISNLLLRPIYKKIGLDIRKNLSLLSGKLESETGLKISYGSLSPSVLREIAINEIYVFDSQSEKVVARIKRGSLSYSIWNVLKGDFRAALDKLSLHDIDIEIIEDENDFWLKKILKQRKLPDLEHILENLKLENIDLSFLKDASIYRLHILYKGKKARAEGEFSRAVFSGDSKSKIDAKLTGKFNSEIAGQKASGDLDFSLALPNGGFEGSSSILRFGNLDVSQYNARYLGFLAEYKNRNLSIKTLPGLQDFFVQVSAALDTGELKARVFADDFSIPSFVQTTNKGETINRIFGIKYSLNATADYNIKTKKLRYDSKGKLFIPAKVIPKKEYADNFTVSYAVSGDDKEIDVSYFNALSRRFKMNVSAEGKYGFKTKKYSYKSKGKLFVPAALIPRSYQKYADDVTVSSYSIYGNENQINVINLNALSRRYKMDASFSGAYNWNTKKFNYKSNGKLFVPADVIPFEEYAADFTIPSYSVYGDENEINVANLNVLSTRYRMDAAFSGAYNWNTKNFNYRSNGKLLVPADLIPYQKYADNFFVTYSVYGNKNEINVLDFKTVSDRYKINASLNGSLNYSSNFRNFNYVSKGDIFIPAALIPYKEYADDIFVSYSVFGNERKIKIPELKTSGNRYNLSFEGSYDFYRIQPEGNLYIESVVLPNGGEISSEFYIEPRERGFMCFSPEVNFGKKTFTAMEFDVTPTDESWDFNFETFDYSHAENETPGQIAIFGSYVPKTRGVQTSLSFDSVHLDSIVLMYSFFAKQEIQPLLENAANFVSPFVFSCDSYAFGEKGDYSFNLPYALIANTVRDDQMLMLSADGNNQSINVSNFEFVFGGQRILMNADSEFLGKNEGRSLNGSIDLNGITYNFTGLFDKDWITLNSEYDFNFSMNMDTSKDAATIMGSLSSKDFPLQLSGKTFAITDEFNFSYSFEEGLNVLIPRFYVRLVDGKTSLNPALALSGSMDSKGLYFDNIAYSDIVSTLSGNGNFSWHVDGKNFDSAYFLVNLSSASNIEKITLSGDISNPLKTPLNIRNIFSGKFVNDLFLSANMNVDSLRSQRLVPTSRESDSLSGTIALQGGITNPFINLSIPRAVFTVNNEPLVLSVDASIDDMVVEANNVSLDYGVTQVHDFTALFDIRKCLGNMKFAFETKLFGQPIRTNVYASAESLSEVSNGIPDSINFSLETDVVRRGAKETLRPLKLNVAKLNDDLIISSSENIGINGTVSKYKDINLRVDNPMPFAANIDGVFSRDEINLAFTGIKANLPNFMDLINYKMMNISKGDVTGGFTITGNFEKPEFHGALNIDSAEFNFPNFFKKYASTDLIVLFMEGSQFYTEPTRCYLRRDPVDVTVGVQMNRFAFESLDVHVQTVDENFVPLNIDFPELHIKGDFLADMDIGYENKTVSVSGDVKTKNTNAEFGATRFKEIFSGLSKLNQDNEVAQPPVNINLNVDMLSRVQIAYNAYTTFLRCLVVPGSNVEVTYFGDQDRLLLDGNVPIRSGEIGYLNTNFYIKEGNIHFSDSDESFDPRVTIHAEAMSRDDNNERVTISLDVENQYLSEISPRLSASPAKSEREIMELLGGIVTANSGNAAASLALSTGDYTIQTIFIRKLENALRDFFKFDIFSLRTMVVQNAVKQGASSSSDNSNLIGNYLDGTTVYIGKYLSNALFADAMLRLDYDENRISDKYSLNGLTFKPEIGFELDAPFVKMRWSFSPEFEDLLNLDLVKSTALTLSWKITF